MNPMKFFWGLLITTLGVLILGMNLGFWAINILLLVRVLLPVIIIAVGIRFLVDNDRLFMFIAFILVAGSIYLVVATPKGLLKRIPIRQYLSGKVSVERLIGRPSVNR